MLEIEKKFALSFKRVISNYDNNQEHKIYATDDGVIGDVIYLNGSFTLNQLDEIKCMLDYFCKHPELNNADDFRE